MEGIYPRTIGNLARAAHHAAAARAAPDAAARNCSTPDRLRADRRSHGSASRRQTTSRQRVAIRIHLMETASRWAASESSRLMYLAPRNSRRRQNKSLTLKLHLIHARDTMVRTRTKRCWRRTCAVSEPRSNSTDFVTPTRGIMRRIVCLRHAALADRSRHRTKSGFTAKARLCWSP